MQATIRKARVDDADALTKIAFLSKQANGYDDAFMAACADDLRVTPQAISEGDIWVAETDRAVGFVCLTVEHDGDTGTVSLFFIDPESQGRGIGRLLWQSLLKAAQTKGLRMLTLDSDPDAEGFYRTLGFKTVGRVPSSAIPGRTLPHMVLNLAAQPDPTGS